MNKVSCLIFALLAAKTFAAEKPNVVDTQFWKRGTKPADATE